MSCLASTPKTWQPRPCPVSSRTANGTLLINQSRMANILFSNDHNLRQSKENFLHTRCIFLVFLMLFYSLLISIMQICLPRFNFVKMQIFKQHFGGFSSFNVLPENCRYDDLPSCPCDAVKNNHNNQLFIVQRTLHCAERD